MQSYSTTVSIRNGFEGGLWKEHWPGHGVPGPRDGDESWPAEPWLAVGARRLSPPNRVRGASLVAQSAMRAVCRALDDAGVHTVRLLPPVNAAFGHVAPAARNLVIFTSLVPMPEELPLLAGIDYDATPQAPSEAHQRARDRALRPVRFPLISSQIKRCVLHVDVFLGVETRHEPWAWVGQAQLRPVHVGWFSLPPKRSCRLRELIIHFTPRTEGREHFERQLEQTQVGSRHAAFDPYQGWAMEWGGADPRWQGPPMPRVPVGLLGRALLSLMCALDVLDARVLLVGVDALTPVPAAFGLPPGAECSAADIESHIRRAIAAERDGYICRLKGELEFAARHSGPLDATECATPAEREDIDRRLRDNLRFMTRDEYRRAVGERQYLLETDELHDC